MDKKIYICYTVYHIYIVLLKHVDKLEKIDLVLVTTIPEVSIYKEKLINFNFIKSICVIEENKIEFSNKYDIASRIKDRLKLCKYVDQNLKLSWRMYDYIFIFNDNTRLGQYLNFKGIRYHLIEDGLDVFKTITKMHNLSPTLKKSILSFLKLKWLPYGQSHYAKSIEVNDLTNLNNKKYFEVRRDYLVKNLSLEGKSEIFNFFGGDAVNIYLDKKIVLILTQPFFQDNLLSSIEDQLLLYREIIEYYQVADYHVILKPHPRDIIDYSGIMLSKEDILPSNLPIEVLNFKEEFMLDTILSVSSTALDGITFARNKVQLGWNYLNNFKNSKIKDDFK